MSKNAGRHSVRRGDDGSFDFMMDEDWSKPQSVKAIKQGVRTYNILAWSLNKHNYAGMVLDETLNKLQDFCWITNEKEQVAMLTKFIDKYFEINCGNFSKGTPPLVFKDAYDLAQKFLREWGSRSEPLSNAELEKLQQGDRNPRVGGYTLQKEKKEKRERYPNKTKSGDFVCFGFNSLGGCQEGQKAGVSPGGHCQKNGKKYIHLCSHYDPITKELCAKTHARSSFNK